MLVMLLKIATALVFLCSQFIIAWYGHTMGQLPSRGQLFGWQYDSAYIRLLITQMQFIWVPILINLLYGMGFQWGERSFGSFIIIISLWLAAGPIAAILFNLFVLKQSIDWPTVLGLVLITTGALIVVAHEEIRTWFS